MKTKEIKTAIKVLEAIDYPVDKELLLFLSRLINQEKKTTNTGKKLHKIKIVREDGTIIAGTKNAEIFHKAIIVSGLSFEELAGIHVTQKQLVVKHGDKTMKGYTRLSDDTDIYNKYASNTMKAILDKIIQKNGREWVIILE